MALKQVVVSDLSGEEVPDDKHARIVINSHPALESTAVELDVSTDESAKLQTSQIDLVNLVVYEPNAAPRRVVLDRKNFDGLFKGQDVAALLSSARSSSVSSSADTEPRRRGRPRGASPRPAQGQRADYTSAEHMGELHRGRVTEAEAAMVREDRDSASKNRERQTGQPIDWNDPKEKKRYGL